MLLDFADFELAGGANQVLAQVEARMLAVEKFEARDQAGGNDQRRVGILITGRG